MMKNLILQNLKYKGEKKLLVENQNVNDIIGQLLKHHEDHAVEYDKISSFFIRETPLKTIKSIFNFLKNNVDYVVENTENQRLKSPSVIVYSGKTTGSDCKNYSLFINGILDSLNRKKVFNIPFCYRFSSYKYLDTNPQHVFAVAYPNTKFELWIDPVLNKFNERKNYTYKIDKKPMALYSMSGIDSIGRKTREERKAKRSSKKSGRRYGENCKGRTLTKYSPIFILARKSYLLLLRLNFLKMGYKMYFVLQNPQTRIKAIEKWCKFGGTGKTLLQTVAKVERKLRMKRKITGGIGIGLGCSCSTSYAGETIGLAPAVIPAAYSSALPIITAMSSLMVAASRFLPSGSKAKQILETSSEVVSDVSAAASEFSDSSDNTE